MRLYLHPLAEPELEVALDPLGWLFWRGGVMDMKAQILDRIWAALKQLWTTGEWQGKKIPNDKPGAWGPPIADAIAAQAPRTWDGRGVQVRGNKGSSATPSEYLVDQCWRIGVLGAQPSDYCGLLLAAEIEVSEAKDLERWWDLVKLSDVRADLRVFVGKLPARGDMEGFVRQVASFMSGHRHVHPVDRLLLALYHSGVKDALHGWLVHGDGVVEPL